MGRNLHLTVDLKSDVLPCTDGHEVRVGPRTPDLYLHVERVLAHITFGLDHILRGSLPKELESGVLGVLDFIRVRSRWRRFYAGSANRIRRLDKSYVDAGWDTLDFTESWAGHSLDSIGEMSDVALVGLARHLLGSESAELKRFMGGLSPLAWSYVDPFVVSPLSDLLGFMDESDIQEVGGVKIRPGPEYLKEAIQGRLEDSSEGSDRPTPYKVVWKDAEVAAWNRSDSQDDSTAAALGVLIRRILGKKRHARSVVGPRVDVDEVIRCRTSGVAPDEVFLEDARFRGFSCVVLVDESASMGVASQESSSLREALRAGTILGRGLKVPSVQVRTVGFTSTQGTLRLTRYGDVVGDRGREGSETPTPWALQEVGRLLEDKHGLKAVILVTDGDPAYSRIPDSANRSVADDMRGVRSGLERNRIRLETILVGSARDPATMDTLYGAGHWRGVAGSGMREAILGVAVNLFRAGQRGV